MGDCGCRVEAVQDWAPLLHPWLWFVTMEEVQGHRHSTTYPVVIASIPKATPEPSASEGDKRADDEYENGEES